MDKTTHYDTLPKLLFHQASTRPNATATRAKYRGIWQVKSWREVSEEVRDVSCALANLGFRRGDHIAIIGDLDCRLYGLIAAAHCLGGTAVLVAAEACPSEMGKCLSECDVRFAVVEDAEHLDKLLANKSQHPELENYILLKSRGIELYDEPKLFAYDQLQRLGSQLHREAPELVAQEVSKGNGSDPAAVLCETSASGESVRTVLAHEHWIAAGRNIARTLKLSERDDTMCLLSPAYAWSLLFYCATWLVTGYRVNFPEAHDTVLTNMREIGPTFCFASPNAYKQIASMTAVKMQDCAWPKRMMFNAALNGSGPEAADGAGRFSALGRLLRPFAQALVFRPMKEVLGMSRLRTVLTVSGEIGPEGRAFYQALGVNLSRIYGPAAACGALTVQEAVHAGPDDVGRPLGDIELRIGKGREIEFRGSHVAHGGVGAARDPASGDGWYKSGDAGVIDANGRLSVLGGVADFGKLADGTEFLPNVVENGLGASPYIKYAVAFGHGRPFVSALIVLDADATSAWADRRGISYTSPAALAQSDEVYSLIKEQVAKVNRQIAASGHAKLQIKRFVILQGDLDSDAGELTHMRRPCRAVIQKNYSDLIAALFDEQPESDEELSFDGVEHGGGVNGHVRISCLQPAAEIIQARRKPSPDASWAAARTGA